MSIMDLSVQLSDDIADSSPSSAFYVNNSFWTMNKMLTDMKSKVSSHEQMSCTVPWSAADSQESLPQLETSQASLTSLRSSIIPYEPTCSLHHVLFKIHREDLDHATVSSFLSTSDLIESIHKRVPYLSLIGLSIRPGCVIVELDLLCIDKQQREELESCMALLSNTLSGEAEDADATLSRTVRQMSEWIESESITPPHIERD